MAWAALASDVSVQVLRFGRERAPVVVVGGCAADPRALEAEAAGCAFAPMGPYYPGVRAHASPAYFQSLAPLLARIAREVFGFRRELRLLRSLFSLATTAPENLSLAQRGPHVDSVEPGALAMLHYLTRDDQGGTAFYRHRTSGFETIDAAREPVYLAALAEDLARHGPPPAGYIAGDTAMFERIGAAAPAYNRALIYPSGLLHCAEIGPAATLSPDPRLGRLTLASFLAAR